MSCPNCGNEVQVDEAFCGRCGTPSRAPTGTDILNQPQYESHRTTHGLGNSAFPPPSNAPHTQISSSASSPTIASLDQMSPSAHYVANNSALPRQPQSAIYHDATEAYVFPPVQTGHLLPESAQQYSQGPISGHARPLPERKNSQMTLVLGLCICMVIVLIGAVSGSIIYGSRHMQNNNQNTRASVIHTIPTSATQNEVTPTPLPTVQPTPSAPALAPTPVPDAGFTYCGVECNPYGFMDEYPAGWQMAALQGIVGVQFANPTQPDQVVFYKKLDTATTPDQLLANEIQTMYASQPGYQAASPPQPQMIDGQPWLTAGIVYQSNQQEEHVTVCVSVYQNQSYILELQASDPQFEQVSVAYYNLMVGKFQFS